MWLTALLSADLVTKLILMAPAGYMDSVQAPCCCPGGCVLSLCQRWWQLFFCCTPILRCCMFPGKDSGYEPPHLLDVSAAIIPRNVTLAVPFDTVVECCYAGSAFEREEGRGWRLPQEQPGYAQRRRGGPVADDQQKRSRLQRPQRSQYVFLLRRMPPGLLMRLGLGSAVSHMAVSDGAGMYTYINVPMTRGFGLIKRLGQLFTELKEDYGRRPVLILRGSGTAPRPRTVGPPPTVWM